jgi:hypothetical protein
VSVFVPQYGQVSQALSIAWRHREQMIKVMHTLPRDMIGRIGKRGGENTLMLAGG